MSRSAAASQTAEPGSLNLGFSPLEPAHRVVLEPFLRRWPHPLSGYTFGSLLAWNRLFRFQWAFTRSGALVFSLVLDDGQRHLMQPVGPLDEADGRELLEAAGSLDYPLQVVAVDRQFVESHPWFVERCRVENDRACANYLYLADDLAALAGRRYSSKRNLIAQAARSYQWTVEPLGQAAVPVAQELLSLLEADHPGPSEWQRRDTVALKSALELVGDLGQEGLLVRVDGQPAALTLFEARPPDTLEIHFERALRRYKGLHQIVNRLGGQVARERGLTYVNREEDLGDPGLRQSKLSYHPARLVSAFRLWVVR